MATNRRLASTEGEDFYVTPAWGTRALLRYECFKGEILEPCCGNGAISKVLESAGHKVASMDLIDRGYGEKKDVFDILKQYDNVVTNPPYNIAEGVLKKCLDISKRKTCLLLRSAFLEGAGRYERIYKETPPSRVLIFSKRLSIFPSNSIKTGGGTTSYAWFIWEKEFVGDTVILWIDPSISYRE